MIKYIEFLFDADIDPDLKGLINGAEIKIERREVKKEQKYLVVRFNKKVPYSGHKIKSIRQIVESDLIYRSLMLDEPFRLSLNKFEFEHNGLPQEIFMGKNFALNGFNQKKVLRDEKGKTYFNFKHAYKKKKEYTDAIRFLIKKENVFRYVVRSYNYGQLDQDNEFFYLYQINEALKTYFHPKEPWRKLDIGKKRWDAISRITNNPKFMQSRHRGAALGGKKPAPGTTIRKIRKVARESIFKFMNHLLKKHSLDVLLNRKQ
ncbi:MAG: hypothetical protein JWO30_3447 [Fibrobacteres bacterium]|nr:hypothetical protein [Fibrobacterota bacterium]